MIFLLTMATASAADLIDYEADLSAAYVFKGVADEATALTDLSTNNLDLTNYGSTTWSTGTGFDFDGSNDHVQATTTGDIVLDPESDDFVVCAWVTYDNFANYYLSKNTPGSASGWFAGGNAVNKPTFYAATGAQFLRTTPTVSTATQYLECYVSDRSSTSGNKIYVDGSSQTLGDNVAATTSATSAASFKIGKDENSGGYFNGKVASVYVWKGAGIAQDFDSAVMTQIYGYGDEWDPITATPVSPEDTLTVEVKDIDTALAANNITLTYDGTNYTNVTGNIISINITAEGGNISLLQNFTIVANNYFSQSVTDWNLSSTYVANLTQYPYITASDVFDGATIANFNATIDATTYVSNAGFIYLPLNSSKTVSIAATNYFTNSTTHDFTSATDLNLSLAQSYIYFNITEIITNATASGTITIGSDSKDSDEVWYLPAGSYAATFSGTGYFNSDLVFNVTALDNVTQNIVVSGSIINVTVTQAYTGTVIEDFLVSWDGTNISYTGSATASGVSYAIPALVGYGYNITVAKDGYITKSTVYTTPTNLTSAAFTIYATNHIEIVFYDEETRTVINDVNYTLTSSDFGFTGSTSDGTATFIDLETDKFNLAYTAVNYTDRNHIFNIPSTEDSQTNRSLYLILDSVADDFVLTVQNKLGQTVEGLTASLLRQYVVNNQTVYEVVEMMSPSVALDGATRFTAVPNYVPYLFRVQDAQQNVLFQGSGTTSNNFDTLFLIDSQISIKVDTGTSPFDLSQEIDGFQYSLQNSSTRFWFSYDDTELALESYGLKVYANGTNLIGESTGTNPSAVLSVYYTYDNSTSYRAVAYGVDPTTGTQVPIDSIVMERASKAGVEIFGILSWFILFLSLIVFTIGLASNLTVAILFDILAIVAFSSSFIGIIAISLPVQSGLFIAGLVVVYLMRDK